MIAKRILSAILSILLIAPQGAIATEGVMMVEGQNEFIQINENEEAQVCQRPEAETCSSGLDEKPLQELEPLMSESQINEPPSCGEEDISVDGNKLPKEEVAQIKQDLLKECNKAFKKHKRAFAKQLLKNGRIFGAMKVLMRKKNKLKDIKNENDSKTITATNESLVDLEKKIKEEEDKIVEAFKKEFPGGFNESDPYYNDNKKLCNGKYSLGVDGQMSTPSHIYIDNQDTVCKVDVDVPNIKDIKLPPANLIPPLDITDSFPDDCAFMVSDKFTEADALKLLGAKSRSDYCSANQQISKSDAANKDAQGKNAFDDLDQWSDSFTQAADEGLTPDFTLNVSRNLYRDEVRPLAQKRGEFVQKYVFKQLQENAKGLGEKAPAWMTSFDEFSKVFKLKFPKYEGQSTVGDYGPNPSATGEEMEIEKKNLKLTLENKVAEINKSISSIEDKNSGSIKKINDLIAGDKKLKKEFENKVSSLSKSMEKKSDFNDMNKNLDDLNELNKELYKVKFRLAQSERKLQEDKDMLAYHKARLVKTNPQSQVALLDQFYKNHPEGFDRDYKNAWDEKLFKNFKMVAVEGTFKGEKEFTPDLDSEITPKIQYTLEKVINSQAFSCNYSIGDLYRKKLEWDKGSLKFGKWAKKNIWNPTFMAVKFVAGGELLLLGHLLKPKGRSTDCFNFGKRNLFKTYMRWGSKKVYNVGHIGKFDSYKKHLASYDGDYGECVEEEEEVKK